MRDNRDRMIHEMHRKKREKSVWRKVVTVLASVVVFCTTYALILPAITMDTQKTMVSILKINDDANPETLAGTDPAVSRRCIAARDCEPEKTNAPGDRRQRNQRDLPPWWNLCSGRMAGFCVL